MDYIWPILSLVLLNAVWLVSIVAGLPGTWLMVGSAVLVQWWRHAPYFSAGTLVTVVVLAGLGEVFEFATRHGRGPSGRAGRGMGRLAPWGGGVVGALSGNTPHPDPLLIGTLIGACPGSGWRCDPDGDSGWHANGCERPGPVLALGWGASWARSSNLAIGVIIWVILAIAAFWP